MLLGVAKCGSPVRGRGDSAPFAKRFFRQRLAGQRITDPSSRPRQTGDIRRRQCRACKERPCSMARTGLEAAEAGVGSHEQQAAGCSRFHAFAVCVMAMIDQLWVQIDQRRLPSQSRPLGVPELTMLASRVALHSPRVERRIARRRSLATERRDHRCDLEPARRAHPLEHLCSAERSPDRSCRRAASRPVHRFQTV